MSDATEQQTELAGAVLRSKAGPVADGIFMSEDVSNSYLVTTGAESLLVNAGTFDGGPRHRAYFESVSDAPIRYVVFTQAHDDHYGGFHAFRGEGVETIAQARYPLGRTEREALRDHYTPRNVKLWGTILGASYYVPRPEWPIDILVEDRRALTLGDLRFEVLAVPGGETLDSLAVWLPDRGAVFTGNQFGPLFLHVPNLNTTRGDRQRSVQMYLDSLDRVRALDAELLVTGHGEPISGRQRIRDDLTRMHDALSYLRDRTFAGMNAGKDVWALMREISLPEQLRLGEGHGNVRWAVRTIWEEYAGWFHFDETTSLYAVPQRAIHAELVAAAGGPGALVTLAHAHLAADRLEEAMHHLEIVLNARPEDRDALTAKRRVLERLLERGQATNLSETMWLRAEIRETEQALGGREGPRG